MNKRNCTINKRYKNIKRNSHTFKKNLLFFTSLFLVVNTFLALGIVANAKDNEVPMYKYYKSYLVEKDDTLFSIAYDMNDDQCSRKQIEACVDEMISLNSLDHKGTICYGNYIIVPYYSTEYR
jgi:hypothetical protein